MNRAFSRTTESGTGKSIESGKSTPMSVPTRTLVAEDRAVNPLMQGAELQVQLHHNRSPTPHSGRISRNHPTTMGSQGWCRVRGSRLASDRLLADRTHGSAVARLAVARGAQDVGPRHSLSHRCPPHTPSPLAPVLFPSQPCQADCRPSEAELQTFQEKAETWMAGKVSWF